MTTAEKHWLNACITDIDFHLEELESTIIDNAHPDDDIQAKLTINAQELDEHFIELKEELRTQGFIK